MAKYFTLDELVRSETALRCGIDNTPPSSIVLRLEALVDRLLDPVRELWGAPLRVTSGYRCPELNAEVGGASSSQHLSGEAADITTGTRKGNRRLFEMLVTAASEAPVATLNFDQLIDEQNYSWLHVSYRAEAAGQHTANRGRILHL